MFGPGPALWMRHLLVRVEAGKKRGDIISKVTHKFGVKHCMRSDVVSFTSCNSWYEAEDSSSELCHIQLIQRPLGHSFDGL